MLSDRALAAHVPELEIEVKAKSDEIEQLRVQQQEQADGISAGEARVAEYAQRIMLLEKERDERRAESARHKRRRASVSTVS